MLQLFVNLQSMLDRSGDEEGQTTLEYALVLALIVIAIITAVTVSGIGADITGMFQKIGDKLAIT